MKNGANCVKITSPLSVIEKIKNLKLILTDFLR